MNDPATYSPAVRSLLEPARLLELGAGRPNDAMRAPLEALNGATMFGGARVMQPEMAAACRAGLWLYHDFLDRSHGISQEIETPTGSFWHAIMHRREGDFSNAKYWFHRVGRHPVFRELAEYASPSSPSAREWDPFGFVDRCQRALRAGGPEEAACRELQQQEWTLLFDHCYQAALRT